MSGPGKQDQLAEFASRSRAIARRSQLDIVTVKVVKALESAGVDALVLKGPALANELYGPGEVRAYSDVDLLIAPADVRAAGTVLEHLGYANVTELLGVDDIAGALHGALWSQATPELGSVTIDLHWRIEGCEAPAGEAWLVLSARRRGLALAGSTVATLDRPGLALHVALHAAQHGPTDLKAIADLTRGIERWPIGVWRDALELSRDIGARESFAAGLQLVPAGAALADQLKLPRTIAGIWSSANQDQRPRGAFHMKALSEANGWRQRTALIRRAVIPPRNWITWEYPWAMRGRAALLAAYLAHLLRAPVWVVRAQLFRRRAKRD